jgi:ParE toxin of type II toxin-antitoxin system, parDE
VNVRFTNIAEIELADTWSWYEARVVGLGDRFIAEVREGVEKIKLLPLAWHPLGDGVRRYRLNKFPYGLYYVILEEEGVIFSVGHLHRRPHHWKQRLQTVKPEEDR